MSCLYKFFVSQQSCSFQEPRRIFQEQVKKPSAASETEEAPAETPAGITDVTADVQDALSFADLQARFPKPNGVEPDTYHTAMQSFHRHLDVIASYVDGSLEEKMRAEWRHFDGTKRPGIASMYESEAAFQEALLNTAKEDLDRAGSALGNIQTYWNMAHSLSQSATTLRSVEGAREVLVTIRDYTHSE